MLRRLALLGLCSLLVATPALAADNIFDDLVVGPTGYLTGDADDRYLVRGDFLNSSARPTDWSTALAELVFENGPAHVFTLTGEDRGSADESGLADNFAWGTLRLRAGQTLALQDGNAAPGGAQYVTRLVLEDGLPQVASITGNGMLLYYDARAPENAYLSGATYPLAGGGALAPFPVAPVPGLGPLGLAALATGLLWRGRRSLRRAA